jgi:hypothetical protein
MTRILITYCLSFLFISAPGQTFDSIKVVGKAVSAITGDPVSDATIMYSKTRGVITDSLGRFTIYDLPKGKYKLSFTAFGFGNNDTVIAVHDSKITNVYWIIKTNCQEYNSEKALKDIKENNAMLLLQNVFSSMTVLTGNEVQDFKREFGIIYYDFGNDVTVPQECLRLYNQTIFSSLDKKFGDAWRKKVRKDVVGFK